MAGLVEKKNGPLILSLLTSSVLHGLNLSLSAYEISPLVCSR